MLQRIVISLIGLYSLAGCATTKPLNDVNEYRDILYKGCMEAVAISPHQGTAPNDKFCMCSVKPLAKLDVKPEFRAEVKQMLSQSDTIRSHIVRQMIVSLGAKQFRKCAGMKPDARSTTPKPVAQKYTNQSG